MTPHGMYIFGHKIDIIRYLREQHMGAGLSRRTGADHAATLVYSDLL
jgi:hypothetical protein